MKRNSLTAICQKAQKLTLAADYFKAPPKYLDMIIKAQVNEIIRLNAEEDTTEIDMEAEQTSFWMP